MTNKPKSQGVKKELDEKELVDFLEHFAVLLWHECYARQLPAPYSEVKKAIGRFLHEKGLVKKGKIIIPDEVSTL